MATKKVVAASKDKTTKVPAKPPKPKFGQVGYEFNIKAKITEVHPDNNEYNSPFKISLYLGNLAHFDEDAHGNTLYVADSKAILLDVVSKESPAVLKQLKQEELEKAKAEVVRLTKELAEIK